MLDDVSSGAIGAVVAEMDRVRAGLPRRDGIGVFIDVYRQVTALVAERVTDRTFTDHAFVEDLDVGVAQIFLDVPRARAAGRPVSQAWEPLIARRRTGRASGRR